MMEIVATESADGFLFRCKDMSFLEQPHMQYPGYRINFEAQFGRMKDRIHIDIGTGDIVNPTTSNLDLVQYRHKPLFESQISLLVYPTETIFAEKLETVISKGAINSRMKDYHDLLLLTRSLHLINFDRLQKTIQQTFHHRGTTFELINFSNQDLKSLGKLWTAHLKNLGNIAETMHLPVTIQDAIKEINDMLIKLTTECSLI